MSATQPQKRMSLSSVSAGRVTAPIRITLVGQPGAGKTTFGARADRAIILPVEEGSNELDVPRFPGPESFADVKEAIASLAAGDMHPYRTLVIDGIDALEALIWTHVCDEAKQKSIESFGYGKGYVEALGSWRILLAQLDNLRHKRGMNIILIGHTVIKPFNDPSLMDPYDRYEMRLHKAAAGLLSQWSDVVAFAVHDDVVVKGETKAKTRAVGTGGRLLRVSHTPSMDAKNRLGITEDLELSWSALMAAIENTSPTAAATLRADIAALLPALPEAKRPACTAALEGAGTDVAKLRAILATAKGYAKEAAVAAEPLTADEKAAITEAERTADAAFGAMHEEAVKNGKKEAAL